MMMSVQVDAVDDSGWADLSSRFSDLSIYQTRPYEVVKSGRESVSHVVIRRESDVVAAVQARVVRLPFLGSGVGYVRGGPLWQHRDRQPSLEVFRQVVRALRAEYVGQQRLCLRLVPNLYDDENRPFSQVLQEEKYVARRSARPYRTILMDLAVSPDELSQGLHHKWRYHLNKARKQNLELIEGSGEELFQTFEQIYDEMVERKRFVNFVDIRQFKAIQRGLPPEHQMRVFICKNAGEVCAGGIVSALGDTATYLFGATSSIGLKTHGSYLVHWAMLLWAKSMGCRVYDLNGVDPVRNSGGYQFKRQLGATHGREVTFIGEFDAYPDSTRRLLLATGDLVRTQARRVRQSLAKW